MSHKIYEDEYDSPMLHIFHGGRKVFGMTLESVAPESRQWLARHIDEAFAEAIESAKRRAVADYQAEMRKLLGIKEPA